MPHELPKAYDPSAIEARWAEYWVKEGLFEVPSSKIPTLGKTGQGWGTPVFCMQLPPPNVTGRLHMGHMLNHTQMDIMARWHRMRGFVTEWLPGTDHAGIATQMMVERQLASEGKQRRQMGREAFVERVWEWKRHYGGAIVEQMKRIGDTVDWSREYFTMDENLSRAVREVFVRLYEEGLIYRGKYIVNWCPGCLTAISDLEVVHEETPGKLYEIKYPVIGSNEFITVATTRPETMLGDTAVAVNPRDARYAHLHGKRVMLPLMEREIPIILDELAQPEFGTGAVKVTPAHDPNDFQAGLRHNLPQIDIMDETAHMNQNAGAYAGLDRFAARERVVADLRERGLLAAVKDYVVPVGKCDRSKDIVEPRLSTQWFMAMTKEGRNGEPSLAARGREVVARGEVRFTPENYKTIYLHWMENIHDWCISRQLWWGHRIPAWYCAAHQHITVARETPAKCATCGSTDLTQESDVLDTWFSSGLLPFTSLGWPEKTRDQEIFYPSTLLITAYEILFFWVARMIMFGCHFMRDHKQDAAIKQASGFADRGDDSVPFREVYIHALVRDAERQKMSKTKGNVIDPIEIIGKYGTDATRFTLAAMASPGTDIAFNPARTEGYRAFANKIWNAARFIFMNMDRGPRNTPTLGNSGQGWGTPETLEDRWILSRFHRTARELNEALESYRFDEAAHRVYTFFWGDFCDWYIELSKLRLNAREPEVALAALAILTHVFDGALRMLSPFMPFITEELWHALYGGKPELKSIALAAFPEHDDALISESLETEMSVLQDLIVSVRQMRHDLKIEPKVSVPIRVFADDAVRRLIEGNREAVERLANVSGITFVDSELSKVASARHTARFDVVVEYEKKVDTAAERARLEKDLAKMETELANARRQLANEQFLAKAPEKVVEGLRRRAGELAVLIEKAQTALQALA
ncbi:MAG TPA: valine--tRNA ligase [Terriglobales bacterium]|nr:valine--tRNA ligase [Terriglobales bacterium]